MPKKSQPIPLVHIFILGLILAAVAYGLFKGNNGKTTPDSPLTSSVDGKTDVDAIHNGKDDIIIEEADKAVEITETNTAATEKDSKNTAVTTQDIVVNNDSSSSMTGDIGNKAPQNGSASDDNKDADVITGAFINITEKKGYETVQEAIEEADNGSTIKLMDDISLDTGLSIDKDIVLDLNGMEITSNWNANEEGNESAIALNISGIATIKNGTIVTDNGTGGIQASGTDTEVTLENITIDQNGLNPKRTYNSTAVTATNGARITIISGNYSAETDGVVVKSTGGTVIIEGGTFTAGRSAARNDALEDSTHSLTINGGTFNAEATAFTGGKSYALFSAGVNAETAVNGGTFNGEVSSEYSYMTISVEHLIIQFSKAEIIRIITN